MTLEHGGFMQTVRTAVLPDVYDDEVPAMEPMTLTEWLAAIGQDVLTADRPNKILRLLSWLHVADALPMTAYGPRATAAHCEATESEVMADIQAVARFITEDPSMEVRAMLKAIADDILAKRSKIMRFCNWLRIMKACPPELETFQAIADFCGVARQAVKKDGDEIFAGFPSLMPRGEKTHNKTNISNRRL